ncbi:FecR family protein [Dyadobacter luticola]|nr:FecR family protein [Dyadobacter luticola]
MTQDYIRQLAKKFLDGTATEEEKKQLHAWYDSQDANSDMTPDEIQPEVVKVPVGESGETIRNRMLDNLKALQNRDEPVLKYHWVRRFTFWSSAAAAVVIAGFLFLKNTHKTQSSALQLVQAPLGKTLDIKLPDGSHIWLNAGSTLTYPKSFSGKTREVVLREGQAFFDIVHDKTKPFIVHAKALNITVLGTSFDVKAYRNDPDIKVTVKTGKVGVTLRDKPEHPAVMLLPAEQAVVAPEQAVKIQVNEISKPAIAPWKDNRMVFEDELLPEIFHALERKYKQHIVVEKPDLLTEKISLTLHDQPLADVLKVLGFSKKFNYSQLNDSTIVVR